jgi:hypothetical protein
MTSSRKQETQMKLAATMTLMFTGCAASLCAQSKPVKMTFSGSMVATSLDMQPNSVTDEEHLAGTGSLGPFTFRKLRVDGIAPRASSTCTGPTKLNIPVLGGGGVFRFQDGSLLTVAIKGGDLCIDFTVFLGYLTETYQITGGTGRFEGAAASCQLVGSDCTLRLTATLAPLLADSSGTIKMLTSTGEFEGSVSARGF